MKGTQCACRPRLRDSLVLLVLVIAGLTLNNTSIYIAQLTSIRVVILVNKQKSFVDIEIVS